MAEKKFFDVKQLISTVVAILFAGGLILLVGVHIGKRVETPQHEEKAQQATQTLAQQPVAALENNPEYRFFELLDAPAPSRPMPELQLPVNPALDKKKAKKEEKSNDEARAVKTKKQTDKADKEPAPKAASKKQAEPKKAAPKKELKAQAKPAQPAAKPASQSAGLKAAAPVKAREEKAAPAREEKAAPAREEKAAPAKAKEDKAPANAAKKTGRYTVQVSAFQDKGVADDIAKDLRARGYKVQVKSEEVAGRGVWHRVRVGKTSDRASAEALLTTLKQKEGFMGFVTSY